MPTVATIGPRIDLMQLRPYIPQNTIHMINIQSTVAEIDHAANPKTATLTPAFIDHQLVPPLQQDETGGIALWLGPMSDYIDGTRLSQSSQARILAKAGSVNFQHGEADDNYFLIISKDFRPQAHTA